MENWKVSVVVPCYNMEEYVTEMIESIIAQSIGFEKNIQLILVDDASKDSTPQILKDYENRYPDNICVILCEKNGRQGTATNIGLQYATGEYCYMMGADDAIHPDMFRRLIDIIEKNDCDLVQFRYKYVKDMSEAHPEELTEIDYKVYEYAKHRKDYLLNSSILDESASTKFYRKSLLDRAGSRYAEQTSYEEPLFTYPLKFYVNRVAVTETMLYYYRANPHGSLLCHQNNPATIPEHFKTQQEIYMWMQNTEFMDEYKDEIDLYFVHSFYCATFYFMLKRGMTMTAVVLRYMVKVVKSYVPNFRENPYWSDASLKEEATLLDLTDCMELSDEELEAKAAEYMSRLTAWE